MITNAIQNPFELYHMLDGNKPYPIFESNLRSPKDKTKLTMVKIHAELLKVGTE